MPLLSHETGYVQRIDYDAVAQAAARCDAVVWIRQAPGAFLVKGTPLAFVHPSSSCDARLTALVQHACIVGRDRTLWQDPEFAVKQLVEIALRALSPAVNEPFTAMTCIDRLTEGLAAVGGAPVPRAAWRDDRGIVRVYTEVQSFPVLLRASFDPIRIFAGQNPAIYARLFDSLVELSYVAGRAEDRAALAHQAEVIWRAASASLLDEDDRGYVAGKSQLARAQLGERDAGA